MLATDRVDRVARCLLPAAAVMVLLRLVQAHGIKGYDAYMYWVGAKAFAHGANPYVHPTFVVPPTGLAFVAPLSVLPWQAAYAAMMLLGAVTIGASVYLLAGLVGEHRTAVRVLLAAVVVAGTSGAYTTIGFGNLNGVVLLAFVVALWAARDERWVLAGAALGVSLAVKPVLWPALLVLLALRRWRAAAAAVAVPVGLALLSVAWDPHVLRFATRTAPFLLSGLHNRFLRFDLSIQAVATRLHVPHLLALTGRAAVGAVAVAVAVAVWRRPSADRVLSRPVTRLVEVTGVLTVATLLAGSFGWRYYTVFLLPLLFTVALGDGLVRSWLCWLGVALAFLPDSLGVGGAGRFDTVRPTLGLGLLLLGVALAAVRRYSAPTSERGTTAVSVRERFPATL